MRAAPRLLGALLLLQVLQLQLHGCLAIYDPDDDGAGTRGPPEVDDDEGAGVITVHAGKRKPPAGSWGAPPPPPPPPAVVGRGADCPPAGRKRRSPAKSKPLPVRQKIKRQANNYHCPDSWKDLDFSEVQELECPQNATGWFPFPPDCRKYLNCWKGRGFLQACAPATVFHPIRRECDYPEKVKCLPSCRSEPEDSGSQDGDVIGGDPTDYVDPEDPDAVSPLLDLRSVPAGPVRRVPPPTPAPAGRDRRGRRAVYDSGRLQCLMEGGTGLAPHPTECSKFVNCWQGKPHIQGCAPGTLFNPRLNACDHPHKVPECVNGKRDPSRLAAGQRAQGGGDGGGDGGREGAVPTHHGGGGYHQFGNQGYQPPPRQTFNTGYGARDGDQVPAASSFQGYGPNQVAPPPGRDGPKGKGLQPRPGAQDFSEPNLDAETIASAGVIGPLPGGHGHSEAWHREHGRGMPGQGPPHHHHQQHHHYHHQHTPQPDYTPTPTWHSSNPGGYSSGRQPASYTPQPAYNPGRDYTPQTGAYSPARDYTPQSGAHAHGHNPQWHHDHGVPMPGGHHHHNHNHHNHNPEWHSAHGVPMPGQGQYGGRRDPEPYPEYETTTAGYTPPTTTCAPESADFDDDGYDGDVDLLDVRTGDASNWISVVDRTKNSSMPQSGQMVRLRGGSTALEGYVEVMGPGSRWGSVCDKPAGWTVEEASVVCRSLGYERGAELAWQGRPRGQRGVLPVHVEEVRCSGGEHSLMSCDMNSGDAGDGCNLETQAAGLRCYPNFAAKCRSGEVQYKGSCYSMVVPRQDRKVDAIAFSQDEAIKHCKSQGGHLLDINNQAEGDFVSEWLSTSYPALSSVLTAGVGVSVPGRSVWVWESSGAPVQYNLWWPGPPSKEQDSARAPKVGERPLCVLLKKDFPCESWPGGGGGGRGYGGAGYGSWQGARSCSAEYFFWHAEDCAIRQKSYPYVCERKADDIGCRGATEYAGPANVSWNGAPCVSWDNPAVVATLRYRVTEDVRLKELAGHNRCRMAGSQEPWCFVDAGASGIREARCDIPVCRENAGNGTASGDAAPGVPPTDTRGASAGYPGLYQPDGRPRPPAGDSVYPYPSPSRPSVALDDPQTDPRGTAAGSAATRPFPMLPTSRPYGQPPPPFPTLPTATRPGQAAAAPRPGTVTGRTATEKPFPMLPTSRPYGQRPSPEERPGAGAPPDPNLAVYAPSFSHREAEPTPQTPPPPSSDLQPPFEDDDDGGQVAEPVTTARPYVVAPPRPARTDPDDASPRENQNLDYLDVPDPLTMAFGADPPRPRALESTAATPVRGYGVRPDPSRGYGLPAAAAYPSRPPVVTARPPPVLYREQLPGRSYAPGDSSQPSYNNLFGLLPAYVNANYPDGEPTGADIPAYVQAGDLRSSSPYSQVGYFPRDTAPTPPPVRPRAGDDESVGTQSGRGQWPPPFNGHTGPGLPPTRGASRQSRTAEQTGTATTAAPTPAATKTVTATPPPFVTPPFAEETKSEHVMKIPLPAVPGQPMPTKDGVTEKMFFM